MAGSLAVAGGFMLMLRRSARMLVGTAIALQVRGGAGVWAVVMVGVAASSLSYVHACSRAPPRPSSW